MLKAGGYLGSYKYVSLNLTTKTIHGIDLSGILDGESYNFIWDGDWWKRSDEFAHDLYEAVKNKPEIKIEVPESIKNSDESKSRPQRSK